MTEIIIGTTPTITYTFKTVSTAEIETAIFTIKCAGEIIIEKTLADASVGDNSLSWTLTQEETIALGARRATMMLNWKTGGGTRGVSPETEIKGKSNHKPEVI